MMMMMKEPASRSPEAMMDKYPGHHSSSRIMSRTPGGSVSASLTGDSDNDRDDRVFLAETSYTIGG